MTARRFWLGSLVLLLFGGFTAGEPTVAVSPAVLRWQMGQEALRNGEVDEAIQLYQESLRLDNRLNRNYLSLAAAYSAKGDENRSLENLRRYVQKQPDHVMARSLLAEKLLRLQQPAAARAEFERCAADLQDHPEIDADKLIHCHSRLMELAEQVEDDYGEHLHRGIGLYLLACQHLSPAESDGKHSVQGLLFRAAAELSAARVERPVEARPCWYLHLAWARLGQQHPANRWLHAAADAAPFTTLTPTERKELQAACREAAVAQARK